jgi:hypothetical protein
MYRNCVCVAALCLTLALAGNAGAQLGQGNVLFEYWDNVAGTSVDTNLRTLATFPNSPTSSAWVNKFQSPSGRADNYGVRGRAFLTPPETGDYTFWVAGDDNCQLWLSTDNTAANATMIAQVATWTGVAEWGKEAGQKSAPVALVAGQKYYIEGLMKEGGGGDSLDVGWAGPGIGDATVVIAGQYLTALIRDPEPLFAAQKPKPADKAIEVVDLVFEWTAGLTAATHEVYVGTSAELTAADYKMTMPAPMYYHMEGLQPGKMYYWRVDEVDAAGVKYPGTVWSFTAMPLEANTPSPADGASFVPLAIALGWRAGQGVTTHDVFLSKDKAAVEAGDASVKAATAITTSYQATGLEPQTTYYWRVDEVDGLTGKIAGAVWSFSTVPLVAKIDDPNLVGWWTFDTEPATSMAVLDMSGNGRYGTLIGGGLSFVQDALMGNVLSLPGGNGKYVSIGEVGISGNDPTTIACWAKARSTGIPDWTLIFGFTGDAAGAGGNGSHLSIDSLGGPGGVGAHAWGWEETMFSDNEALEWHHYAVTYDGTTIRYYGDAVAMDSDVAKSNVQNLAIRGDRVHIGKRRTQESSFPGWVDDCRVYDRVLAGEEIAEIVMALAAPVIRPADITSPRDIVVGVPNDKDWPAGETPMLVVDNRTNTKFLHRKGGKQPTGVQITPFSPPSIVTGLTFTTANDAPDRDPVKFEFYGANGSDAWTLIASGDIVDFAGETAWPRFTKNTTAITFANSTVYESYQVLFTALRNPAPATLMQIAEIELIGGIEPPAGTSTLINGDFEDGVLAPWGTYGNLTATVVKTLDGAAVAEPVAKGTSCLFVDVPSKAPNFWEAGLQPKPIVFEAGKKYTFSVWLKAKTADVQINIKPELATSPWTAYGEKMVTVTTQWQEFSVTTPVFATTINPPGLTLHVGNATGGFWVDGARLYEGDYAPAP